MSWWGHTFLPDYYLRSIPRGDDELPAPLDFSANLVTPQERHEYEEWLEERAKGVSVPRPVTKDTQATNKDE